MWSCVHWDYDAISGAIVTSDGKTIKRKPWGVLPTASTLDQDDESDDDEENAEEESGEDMAESGGEEEAFDNHDKAVLEEEMYLDGVASVIPTSNFALRKTLAGEETPAPMERKILYTILHQTAADKEKQNGVVFASDIAYVMPPPPPPPLPVPQGAESVVSKVMGTRDDGNLNKKRGLDDDAALEMGKKFKF